MNNNYQDKWRDSKLWRWVIRQQIKPEYLIGKKIKIIELTEQGLVKIIIEGIVSSIERYKINFEHNSFFNSNG